MTSVLYVNAEWLECQRRAQHGVTGGEITGVHIGTSAAQQLCDGAAASGQADDTDLAASPRGGQRLRERTNRCHRTFSVDIATIAPMIAMIQKRTTTCCSLHPFTSK